MIIDYTEVMHKLLMKTYACDLSNKHLKMLLKLDAWRNNDNIEHLIEKLNKEVI